MTTGEPPPYNPSRQRGQQPGPGGARNTTPKPTGFRRYLPLLVAAWVVLEIWLLIWLAGHIGALGVFAVLLAGFFLGAVIIKRAGRRAWNNLAESLQPGTTPGQADAALKPGSRRDGGGNGLAMLGGLLLMLPGLASDVLGLLCVFPPTAALLRKATKRAITSSSLGEAMQQAKTAQQQAHIHRPDGKVVPGQVVDDTEGQDPNAPEDRPGGPTSTGEVVDDIEDQHLNAPEDRRGGPTSTGEAIHDTEGQDPNAPEDRPGRPPNT